jgi:hypothetical protein
MAKFVSTIEDCHLEASSMGAFTRALRRLVATGAPVFFVAVGVITLSIGFMVDRSEAIVGGGLLIFAGVNLFAFKLLVDFAVTVSESEDRSP